MAGRDLFATQPQQQVGRNLFAERDFGDVAAGMSPQELSVARSKPDAMGAYLRQQAEQPLPGETEEETFKRQYGGLPTERPETGEGVARAALQGGTFGFGDEIVAGGTAALDALLRSEDFGEAYDVRRSQERGKLEQFREDEPVAAYGAEIAGAIPTAVAPWLNVARGGNLLRGVGTGSLQGGIYGFGAGEGEPIEQAKSAAIGAGVGGSVGALAVPVAGIARRLANKMATGRAAKEAGLTGDQYQILNRAMQADDSFTGAGAQRLEAAGPEAMLADTGSGAQRILDSAITESPPAARMANEAVENRVTVASQKLTQALDDTLGAPQGVRTSAKGIAQETSAARSDAYKAAYSTAIDYAAETGRNIEEALKRIPPRIMNNAVEKANEAMHAVGVRNQQILASVADDGTVAFTELPNVQQLDFIKRSLGEMGAAAVDQFGRPTADGRMLTTLARNIKTATSKAVPQYAEAVRLGGDKIERDNALRMGYQLLSARTTRESVKDITEGMSVEARQAAAQGVRSSIDDALANVKMAMTDANMDAREAFKLLKDMSSRASREKMAMILDPADADVLFKQLDESTKAFELRAAVARNSATAMRQATKQGVKDIVEGGPLAAFREGEVIGTPKEIWKAIMGRSPEAKQQVSDEVYMGLVKALTGPRGKEARAALEHLQTVQPLIEQGTGRARNLSAQLMGRNVPVTGRLSADLQKRNNR